MDEPRWFFKGYLGLLFDIFFARAEIRH